MARFCPKCGLPVRTSFVFCPKCGTSLPKLSAEHEASNLPDQNSSSAPQPNDPKSISQAHNSLAGEKVTFRCRDSNQPIASALNFNVVKAELDREGKTAAAAYLNGNRTQGRTLAYAGDGSNELASVPKGGLGVSTSALGNEEAAKADVVILGEGFMRFPAAVRAGRASSRLSFLSVTVHFALRLLMILLALAGVCSPIAAAALFAASSILSYLFASFFFNRI